MQAKHFRTPNEPKSSPAESKLPRPFNTPAKRMTIVVVVAAVVWGAMIVCQGLRAPSNMPDWALMSEVGRRVALGDTLYVDAMDQKGPLCYLTYALLWLIFRTPNVLYVASNVLIWISLVASSFLAARMVEDEQKPWKHLPAQTMLAMTLFVPHVGCIELWLLPLGLLAALWVRRLANGRHVPDFCWVIVGLSAAYAVGAKFTCAAQFVFLVCYGASRQNTKGLGRAVAIALVACAVGVIATLGWVWMAGSFEGMIRHHIHAASDGYAENMSMLGHLQSSNPSTTHVGSFYLGLAASAISLITITRAARKGIVSRIVAIVGALVLMACCFATFVGYYRFQLAPLAVMGALDLKDTFILGRERAFDLTLAKRIVLWVAGIALITWVSVYTCDGTPEAVRRDQNLKAMLHKTIGNDNSVLAWTFGHTWVYAELGLDFPYPIPARYNASTDLWDATAGADADAQKWRYIVVSADFGGVEVGDRMAVNNEWYPVVAIYDNTAIVDAGGGEDALTNPPYRLP